MNELQNFPQEVIEKMLERQVEQGNERDVKVFETHKTLSRQSGGFDWSDTIEGQEFWDEVIKQHNWTVFYDKYPNLIPRVMMVADRLDMSNAVPRVVFMYKCGRYLAWAATTLKEAETEVCTQTWKYALEVESKYISLTAQDISDGKGVGIDPKRIKFIP